MPANTFYTHYQSPVGSLLITGTEEAVTRIVFPRRADSCQPQPDWQLSSKRFNDVCRQLDLYFEGKLQHFDVPLQPLGTDFQCQVWQQLQQIPFGQTASYSDVAIALGNPKATRAVGSANGSNPISIIIPCHRVIGRDGGLTGFGGGLPTKQFLLQLEDLEQLALPF